MKGVTALPKRPGPPAGPPLRCEGYKRKPHTIPKGQDGYRCREKKCVKIWLCQECWDAHNAERHSGKGDYEKRLS